MCHPMSHFYNLTLLAVPPWKARRDAALYVTFIATFTIGCSLLDKLMIVLLT